MSDGLTVPFALAAGLSGASTARALIVTAGLAEIAAGAIAMGLGGYLAARSDAEHYASGAAARGARDRAKPAPRREEVTRGLRASYGLTDAARARRWSRRSARATRAPGSTS